MCRDTLLHGRGIGSPKLLSGKSKLIVSGALIGPETQEGPGQRRDPIREFVGSGDQISRSRPCPGPSGVLGPIEDPEETNLALRRFKAPEADWARRFEKRFDALFHIMCSEVVCSSVPNQGQT